MIYINKTEIQITRGDSAYLTFNLKDTQGRTVTLSAYDNVRCQVRDQADGNLLFEGQVERDNDVFVWHIRPENTNDADIGTYYWDAQVEYVNGDIYSFVPVSKFIILPEITLDEEY